MGGGLFRGLLPPVAGLVGDLHHLAQFVVVKLPAGDLLQLVDDGVELPLHVLGVVLLDLVGVVEGGVEHDQGDVQLLGQVLVPLDHRVADVGGAQEKVRHGHVLRFAVLDLGIGQVHPGIGTQVRGIAAALGIGDEGLGIPPGADGGGVVFRIHGHDVHGGQKFLGGDGGAPAHQPSLGFGLPGLLIVFPQHLVHPLLGRALGRLVLHGQSSRLLSRQAAGWFPGFSIAAARRLCKTTIFENRFQNPSYYPRDKGTDLWYTVGKPAFPKEGSVYEH